MSKAIKVNMNVNKEHVFLKRGQMKIAIDKRKGKKSVKGGKL